MQITGAEIPLLKIRGYALLDIAKRRRELTVCEDGAEGAVLVSQFEQVLVE